MKYLIPELRKYPTRDELPLNCRQRISNSAAIRGFSGASPSCWANLGPHNALYMRSLPDYRILTDSLSGAFSKTHGETDVASNSSQVESVVFNDFSWDGDWLSNREKFGCRLLDLHESLGETRSGFRQSSVRTQIDVIGDARIYPPANLIDRQMGRLYKYLSETNEPMMLKAAVSYIAIVTAHPFSDGNGRVARILFNAVIRALADVKFVYIPVKALEILSGSGLILKVRRAQSLGQWPPIVNFFCNGALLVKNEVTRIEAMEINNRAKMHYQ